MMGPFEFVIALGSIVMTGIVIIAIAGMIKSGFSERKHRKSDTNETRLIQEMHQSLSKLEDRIEALETILLDRERHRNQLND